MSGAHWRSTVFFILSLCISQSGFSTSTIAKTKKSTLKTLATGQVASQYCQTTAAILSEAYETERVALADQQFQEIKRVYWRLKVQSSTLVKQELAALTAFTCPTVGSTLDLFIPGADHFSVEGTEHFSYPLSMGTPDLKSPFQGAIIFRTVDDPFTKKRYNEWVELR